MLLEPSACWTGSLLFGPLSWAVPSSPNLVLYNTLLDAKGRARKPWQAKSIYRELISNGFTLQLYMETKDKGMELNIVLYNTLLAMCADVGHLEVALEMLEDMNWTFSYLITIYSCKGNVTKAEGILEQMLAGSFEPNIFGKVNQTDDVMRTFNRCIELGITPDDRFCGCLLNVLTQTPKEELGKLTSCIETANPNLGLVVKQLVGDPVDDGDFKKDASDLLNSVKFEVKKSILQLPDLSQCQP